MLENGRSGASIVPTRLGISDGELRPKYAFKMEKII